MCLCPATNLQTLDSSSIKWRIYDYKRVTSSEGETLNDLKFSGGLALWLAQSKSLNILLTTETAESAYLVPKNSMSNETGGAQKGGVMDSSLPSWLSPTHHPDPTTNRSNHMCFTRVINCSWSIYGQQRHH